MKYLVTHLLVFSTLFSIGQKFNNDEMHQVGNSNKVYYYYQDTLLGCNYDQDCRDFSVKFTKVEYNKKTKTLYLCGNIFLFEKNRPIINTEIFLAGKIGDTLFDKTSYFFSRYENTNIPADGGKFEIRVPIKKGYYLYFDHPAYALREFDIYRLVNSIKVDNSKSLAFTNIHKLRKSR